MNRFRIVLLGIAPLLLLTAATNRQTDRNDLLKGSYSFVAHGVELHTFDIALSGMIEFDGDGHVVRCHTTFNRDGALDDIGNCNAHLSSYGVDLDGTGWLILDHSFENDFVFAIAVAQKGESFFLNDRGNPRVHTMTGEAKKQ